MLPVQHIRKVCSFGSVDVEDIVRISDRDLWYDQVAPNFDGIPNAVQNMVPDAPNSPCNMIACYENIISPILAGTQSPDRCRIEFSAHLKTHRRLYKTVSIIAELTNRSVA